LNFLIELKIKGTETHKLSSYPTDLWNVEFEVGLWRAAENHRIGI